MNLQLSVGFPAAARRRHEVRQADRREGGECEVEAFQVGSPLGRPDGEQPGACSDVATDEDDRHQRRHWWTTWRRWRQSGRRRRSWPEYIIAASPPYQRHPTWSVVQRRPKNHKMMQFENALTLRSVFSTYFSI